jgi:diketogulonate reductase-like aldo/keto reductase
MTSTTVTLNDGLELPLVGFGTWQLRGQGAYDATRYALEIGYRHIDTATMYGNEAEVGRALRDSGVPRDEVFITTKIPAERAGSEQETLEASRRALGVDRVDLWLIHWPPRRGYSVPMWRALIAERDAGRTRSIGVSNYSTAQLDELISATGETPVANQIPWSPFEHSARRIAEHRERRVVLEGYSPLKGSNLRERVLREIADRHGVTVPQVVLRWHLEHGIPVIPKSARKERIEANLDLFGFSLEPREVAQIDGLSRRG